MQTTHLWMCAVCLNKKKTPSIILKEYPAAAKKDQHQPHISRPLLIRYPLSFLAALVPLFILVSVKQVGVVGKVAKVIVYYKQ